jgi:hypothetical protein
MRRLVVWHLLHLLVPVSLPIHTFGVWSRFGVGVLQGLRTLVVASKTLSQEEWAAWDTRYQLAAGDLANRDEKACDELYQT